MRLNYITIMVRNIEETVRFYSDLAGLKEMRTLELESGRIVFMANGSGDTMLEFVCFRDAPKAESSGITLSFRAEESLELIHKKATDMGYYPSEIKDISPKPACFTVKDPDGIDIEFSI